MHQPFCADPFWNRTSIWDTESPHLSACFRSLALRLAPCILLALLSPVDLLTRSNSHQVKWGWCNILRIVTALIAAFAHADLFVILIDSDHRTGTIEPLCELIASASFLWSACLMAIAKRRGFVRSGTVWIFVLTFTACNAFEILIEKKSRKLYTLSDLTALFSLAINIILLCLSSIADSHKEIKGHKIPVRETASFPSCITFSWADSLAYNGWKRKLQQEDMHALQEVNRTAYLFQLLKKHLFHRSEQDIEIANSLTWALVKAFKWDLMLAAALRLMSDLTQLANPLLLKWLLSYSEQVNEPHWHGYVITFLMCVAAQVSSISQNYHYDSTLTTGVRIRTALMTLIYQKSLKLSNAVRKERTIGEIVNLMAIDADRFRTALEDLHVLWSGFGIIGIGIYLLYQQVGMSAIAGLAILILSLPVNLMLASMTQSTQKQMMKHKDDRVNSMNEILNSMKVIKLQAWEEALMQKVTEIRNKEIRYLSKIAILYTIPVFVMTVTVYAVTLVTFASYVLMNDEHFLDPAKVFFCLSIFNMIRIPLMLLLKQMTYGSFALVAIKRLDQFFASPDITKYVTRLEDEQYCIRMDSAFLTWDPEHKMTSSEFRLKADLKIPENSLIAIVGIVGSGKSSLLSAILGEMQLQTGKVNICSNVRSIAYVPQQAWILNETVKNNILFGSEYDHHKFKQIINACELKQDLLLLPAGDRTEIGEKGINLSGGQRQRISIARACYSDADLFLFDDPLSAVDARVGKKLFQNVFSSKTGLLKGKTRVIVTNNQSILPEVDNIIVLVNGKIAETGSFSELMARGGSFAESLEEFCANQKTVDENRESSTIPSIGPLMRMRSYTGSQDSRTSNVSLFPEEIDVLIQDEKREEGGVRLSVFVNYFKNMPFLWLVLTGFILSQMCDAGSNYWLSIWSEDQLSSGFNITATNNTFTLRSERISVYALIGFGSGIFLLIGSISLSLGTVKAAAFLHVNLLTRIMHANMCFFETTPMGRIVNRFSKDMESIDFNLLGGLVYLIPLSISSIGAMLMIVFAIPDFVFALIPLSLVFLLVQRSYISSARQIRRLESTSRSLIYAQFSETLIGISSIRAYNVADIFVNQFDQRVEDNESCTLSSQDMIRWRTTRLDLIGNLSVCLTSLLSVLAKGSIDPGFIGMAMSYAMTLPRMLDRSVKGLSDVEMEAVSLERVIEYSNIDQESQWHTWRNSLPADWPSEGDIQFLNYSARYRQGLDLVLNGLTAHIKAREKVGIVGRTGAGKSTITLSLFRIIEPASGCILIDGVDVTSIGLSDLRSRLTIIPQDPILFSGSLRYNLDPFGEKSDDQIWNSLQASHLKEFALKLDHGLDHFVTEGGQNLSIGQRQLICLARALLRKTQILILDEATAAVDVETDALIQSTIKSQFTDCTILTIAHRINTILDSDRILVMDEGRVAEFASPDELLKDTNSIFYSLAHDAGIV